MRSWTVLAVVVMSLVGIEVQAAPQAIEDALEEVREALEAGRRDGDRCRDKALGSIKDARGDVEDLLRGGSAKDLERAVESIERAHAAASSACGVGVGRRLRAARRAIQEAQSGPTRARGEGWGGDEGGGRAGGERRERAESKAAVDCWDDQDPGCQFIKEGQGPMEKAAWAGFIEGLRASQPNVFTMEEYLKAALGQQRLTARQLGVIVTEFRPHVFSMLDAVKICAPRLVDPQNGQSIVPLFAPHSFQGADAAKIIAGQPPGERRAR